MNTIIEPSKIIYKYRKSMFIKSSLILIAIIAIVVGSKFALASNQPKVDSITTLNEQINRNDNSMKVNSDLYNVLEEENKKLMFAYTGNKQKQADLNTENNSYRDASTQLRAEIETIIL